MNCKPPFLGIYFRSERSDEDPDIGKLVRVVGQSPDNIDSWDADTLGQRFWCYKDGYSDGLELIDIPKSCVKPIDGGETHEESTEAMRLLTQLPQKEKA